MTKLDDHSDDLCTDSVQVVPTRQAGVIPYFTLTLLLQDLEKPVHSL